MKSFSSEEPAILATICLVIPVSFDLTLWASVNSFFIFDEAHHSELSCLPPSNPHPLIYKHHRQRQFIHTIRPCLSIKESLLFLPFKP
jgi:hypothetical protein